ncbi:NADP-dependent malic enzyme [Novosphingobium lentum]|uniref:NADP-dependent malic enzyme n=1 Tax=Novosphingobium lentum TaxID=145287 RepID=UPI000837351D|nr:NADP-dependent malic enzyme [Novosphingobium lentum]
MEDESNVRFTEREALFFHSTGRPGKIEIIASKPMATQRDLSLAYSPGVAVPVRAIADDPATAYDYTAKGNLVAVISNGTAILGMGNLGALASKPVMEGKAVLFKRFADVDSIDIELDTEDPDKFIEAVALMEPSFGGINLEDIKAPECFLIEQALKDRLKIPVMHDDQHGTAIISAAGLLNACFLTGRDFATVKVVVNGAGAAAIACTALLKAMGVAHNNVTMCDRTGVIYRGRAGIDQFKSAHAIDTDARTLEEALVGADIFLGLSAAGALKPEMMAKMAPQPIIFAMANPDPEITPPDAKAIRPDCIVATGRSDYPNQVNNVLGFPFIFRGALDVRATAINDHMKIAAARAIAELAREQVPEEVAAAYGGKSMQFGHDYIIPAPFDPRLMEVVSSAVAKGAMESGVAQKPIADFDEYRHSLKSRLNPTTSVLTQVYAQARLNPKRVVFAEAENEIVLRAAIQFRSGGYGEPILVGRDQPVKAKLIELGIENPDSYHIENSAISEHVPAMVDMLYTKLQRRGFMERDVRRMVNQDRNVFASALVKLGLADAMITGITRPFAQSMKEIRQVLDPAPGKVPFGIHLMIGKNYTVFLADTTINERPSAADLAHIARGTAEVAKKLGHEPRVAFLSYSTFGNPSGKWLDNIREAVALLDADPPGFEYEGEMAPDAALNPLVMANYPFSRLSAPANVLVMPGLQSANLSAKLLRELAGNATIGPMLIGMEKPVQVAAMTSNASDVLTLAVLAAAGVAC